MRRKREPQPPAEELRRVLVSLADLSALLLEGLPGDELSICQLLRRGLEGNLRRVVELEERLGGAAGEEGQA